MRRGDVRGGDSGICQRGFGRCHASDDAPAEPAWLAGTSALASHRSESTSTAVSVATPS